MRFSLFAHMENTGTADSHTTLYHELLTLVRIADDNNFATFWTGEHHGMEFTITPNPFQVLVDIANKTKNLRLGTGTIIAPFWHPIKLAGEAALADLLTEGRLDLGVARGAYSFEYERLTPGLDAWEAGQLMREILPLLPKLWQGNCESSGEYYPFKSTTSCPKPLQPKGPPIWVAARDPSSHQFALEHGFNVQVTPLWQGTDEITSLMERYQEAASIYKKTNIMLLQHAYIGANKQDCAHGAQALSKFYNYFGAWFKNERATNHGQLTPISDADMASNSMMSPENMMNNLLIGEKNAVIERLKYYEELGYDEFALWLDNSMSHEIKRSQLMRFIDDIMPAFG